jgi:uncharacterized protein (TIGR02246 family)
MFRFLFSILCLSSAMIFGQNDSINESLGISHVVESFDSAWNSQNHKALASLWTNDGDLITPWGRWIRGRTQIEKYFIQEKDGPLEKSKLQQSIDSTRFLTPELILLDTTFTLSGVKDPRANDHSTLAQHGVYLLSKVDNQWKITSLRIFQFQHPIPE